jgi:hypothetical protein
MAEPPTLGAEEVEGKGLLAVWREAKTNVESTAGLLPPPQWSHRAYE